jgi:HAMP domain-containing protein
MSIVTDMAPALPEPRADEATDTGWRVASGSGFLQWSSLATRLFLGASVLIALTLAIAIFVASYQANRVAEERIRADLRSVPSIFKGSEEAYARAREDQVRGLAQQPGTKALLAEITADPLSYHDATTELAGSLGAQIVFMFDAHGALAARSDREPGDGAGRDFSSISWVADAVQRQVGGSAYMLDVSRSRRLLLVASAPVVQGAGDEAQAIGVIAAAFAIDQQRLKDLTSVVTGDVAIIANFAKRDEREQLEILASTSGTPAHMLAEIDRTEAARKTLFQSAEPFGPIELAGTDDSYLALGIPLRSGQGDAVAAFIVARSKAAEMASFRAMQAVLVTTGGLLLLLALPGCYAITRRFTRPLRQLAVAADEIGRGQLDIAFPDSTTGEVGALNAAFQTMVSELRAKADLERIVREMQQQRRPGDITGPDARLTALRNAGGESDGAVAPGQLFANRYEILSCLGQGGMGTVFRARDRELDEEVALKVLNPPNDPGVSLGDAIRHEIKLARAITHANVVRVHDFGEAQGRSFLTMEYVPGTTLRELLSDRGAFELAPGLQIAKQLCRGLSAVHRAGIIHSDLKPRNVMVMWTGVAKLMDFGVARAQTSQSPGGYWASIGGTPQYMSPEQARGAELDERSDVYALGVLMFELFTGSVPFSADSESELLRMHLTQEPPDPRKTRVNLPDSLAALILACLAKSRLQRPATAAELERQLMRVRA